MAMALADTNLNYRRPDLYDQLRGGDTTTANLVTDLADTHVPGTARTLLDLGCGTGRDLEHLATRFDCVGVDVQPQMIAYAHRVRPALVLQVGDLRDVRLGRAFDVITCLGNTLAYIHNNADLAAAFATFDAHAHPGTLLVLYLPVAPSTPAVTGAPPRTVHHNLLDAEVTLRYELDLRAQLETMHRDYRFADGHHEHDVIRRRWIGPRELEGYLHASDFELLELFDAPDRRNQPLRGPGVYAVARPPIRQPGLTGHGGVQDVTGDLRLKSAQALAAAALAPSPLDGRGGHGNRLARPAWKTTGASSRRYTAGAVFA